MSAVELEDVKAHLNLKSGVDDAELQAMIDAAEAAIAVRVGALEPTPVTDRLAINGAALLPQAPALSITSVTTLAGTAIDVSGLWVDPDAGVVRFVNPSYCFASGYYDVVYMVGRTQLPPDLQLAVKEMVRHLWTSQRGGGTRPGSAPDQPAPSYLFPYRVAELLEPHRILPVA